VVALGLIALIVPGIIFAVRWVVVAPVVVVEGHQGTGALRRSWELVKGHGWWVLGVMLVQGLIVGILGAIVAVPADALARSADSEAPALARDVYTGLRTPDGGIVTDGTAAALHDAVRRLRDRFPQRPVIWSPYVHIGP